MKVYEISLARADSLDIDDVSDRGRRLPATAPVVVLLDDGTKILNTALLEMLGFRNVRMMFRQTHTWGRMCMFRWDAEMSEDVLRRATYPRRSDRERAVAERTFEIAAFVDSL